MAKARAVMVADRFAGALLDMDPTRVLLVVVDENGNEGAISLPARQFEAAMPAIEDAVTDSIAATGDARGIAYISNVNITIDFDGPAVLMDIAVPGKLHPTRISMTRARVEQLRDALTKILRNQPT